MIEQLFNLIQQESQNEIINNPAIPNAVSYTHLDVYKRQKYCCAAVSPRNVPLTSACSLPCA